MIEMSVMGIAIDTKSGSPIIILNDKENRRALPIWIGQAEASAIIRILEKVETPRPMTHDLISSILDATSNKIKKIEINDLSDSTYYATIFLEDESGQKKEVDSRPSDAIAIALQNRVPILVTPNVVVDGTISTDEERDEQEKEDFKEFVHNIQPSDFKKLMEDVNQREEDM